MEEQNTGPVPRFSAPEGKILVVDDLPTNLRVVKELLNPCGAKMYVSTSGAKAVEMVQKERYDMVFMDQMMPEMDGMETIARIRALAGEDEYYRSLPIVLLTANAVEETEEALQQQGINGFIAKPIDVAKLYTIIEKFLPPEKIIRQ